MGEVRCVSKARTIKLYGRRFLIPWTVDVSPGENVVAGYYHGATRVPLRSATDSLGAIIGWAVDVTASVDG